MKKILALLLFTTFSYSLTYDFLQNSFNAKVTENSIINKSKKKKVYDLKYSPSKLELTIVEPKLNAGEIYTYTKNKTTLYSPKLKQTVEQTISNKDESLYSILSELSKLETSTTQSKNGKKYVFENNVLKKIIANDYSVEFIEFKNNKPTKIKFISDSMVIDYTISY